MAMPEHAADQSHLPPGLLTRLGWLWLTYCVVKIIGAVLVYHLEGGSQLWKPLTWEGSSMLVASALAMLQLRSRRLQRCLAERPRIWFAACLALLPLWCIVFVAATYTLRSGTYALAGEVYQPGPWLRHFVYESLTLAVFYVLWLGVVYAAATHQRLVAEKLRLRDIELALREAHLTLLRQQLQPHFLFNALNLISATMYEDVGRADTLLRKLAGLLRQAAAQTAQALQPLANELALMRDYADIMAARFEERVEVAWHLAAPPRAIRLVRLPSMISQPLLENAFKYGVEPYPAGCRIEIGCDVNAAGELELSIAQNRGKHRGHSTDGGHGLANVRKRLAAHYGDAATLVLVNLDPEGVCARITLPCAF